MIELLQFYSHQREQKTRNINDVGIAHIAFKVEDLNAGYNSLMDEGVSFNSPQQLSTDGCAKVAFCRAPEGTLIELVEVI